ncbi:MAG: CARDB domain-containing protein [Candidatus Xenobia bacterium]
MNPIGPPKYHLFNIRNGHVESGDAEFDARMDAKLHDWFQQRRSTPREASALPDLTIGNITTDELNVHAGDSPTIEVTVINQGQGDAAASHASVAVNDTYGATEAVPPLKFMQGVEVDFPADGDDPQGNFSPDSAGNYWVIANCDSQHELQESNVFNNQKSWQMSVYE